MNTAGLSLDQAPPIAIPFKFFITAALFSLFTGLIVALLGEQLSLSRWTPVALGITHAITLGFLAQVMTGAIVQLLPVIAGAPVPAAVVITRIVHTALTIGTLLLVVGFLISVNAMLVSGALVLVLAFSVLLFAMSYALIRSQGGKEKIWTLGIGWVSLIPTVTLGAYMVMGLAGYFHIPDLYQSVSLHITWGLIGWVGIVLFAVLFQLLPIFYVTPEFPGWMRRWAPLAIFILLLLVSVSSYLDSGTLKISLLVAVVLLVSMAITVLQRIAKRKRSIMDATLLFISTGILSLMLAVLVWVAGGDETITGILLLGGVCITLPIGIIYKVIPFLCWFHLQSLQVKHGRFEANIPSMKDFISEHSARWHYALHVGALASLLIAFCVGINLLVNLSGLVFAVSALTMIWNLYRAFRLYQIQQKYLLEPNI